jgi:Zn-dependent protease
VGALVMLKQRIDDPVTDARIGLGGPIWGLGAGLAAYAIYAATKIPVWLAIAQITGLLNLFNLIPVWQLDGSRAFHALSTAQRVALLTVIGFTYFATHQKMLLLIGAVALWRVFQKTTVPGDRNTLLKFSALVVALSWLAVNF